MAERRQVSAAVFGAAVASFGFLESLRVLAPSLLRAGDDGVTAAVAATVLGVTVFSSAIALAASVGRLGAHRVWLVGALALLLGRSSLSLPVATGQVQLAAAAMAVAGALAAITGVAAGAPPGADRAARTGAVIGMSAAGAVHAGTATAGWIWPSTSAATVGSLLVVLAIAGALVPTAKALTAPTHPSLAGTDSEVPTAPAWPWWSLTPLMVLGGIVGGVPGRVAVATGWDAGTVAVTVAIGQATAVLGAVLAPRLGGVRTGVGGAVLVLIGTASTLAPTGWQGVLGQVGVATGIGAIVGIDIPRTGRPGAAGVRRRALTTSGAFALFAAITTVHYLSYEWPIPGGSPAVLLATAAFAAALGFTMAWVTRGRVIHTTVDAIAALRVLMVLGLAVVLVGLGGQPTPRAAVYDADGDLRVATYNIRSGFDADRHFDPAAQARALRDHSPDVVVLNEVDRGWLATGGHDALQLFAAELGLRHVRFGGAGDAVFGNALLSRYPIGEFVTEPLPQGRDPMPRGSVAAVLDLPDGGTLGVVGTQLSQDEDPTATRLPQARAVAATVARLRERQIPTVVAGDLYADADSAVLSSFEPLVDHVMPSGTTTFPSDDPQLHRSHVLASSDLRRLRLEVPATRASTHLPVIVTLRPVDPS